MYVQQLPCLTNFHFLGCRKLKYGEPSRCRWIFFFTVLYTLSILTS
jgi:hypothetical protein